MNDCVCSECGHEQATMDRCGHCGSVRTVKIATLVELMGDDWRKEAFGEFPRIVPAPMPRATGLADVDAETAAIRAANLPPPRGQQQLFEPTLRDVDQKILFGFGGGVNSVAGLVLLKKLGLRPTAILMIDPGSEWKHTHAYRTGELAAWLDKIGFPQVTVTDRKTEGQYVPRAWRLETLYEECLRIKALPSIAYGYKKCSQKYKGDTSRWWIARQEWAQAEWAAGRRILKVIGYDAGEPQRVRAAFQNPWENERMIPWYPLVEHGYDRDGCQDLILSEGLTLPFKSACTFCPHNTISQWRMLHRIEPDSFAAAVQMSRNAASEIDSPDVVGLLRNAPHGKRQLHVWVDEGMPRLGSDDSEADGEPMTCDCST